jgi:hypothetical protein
MPCAAFRNDHFCEVMGKGRFVALMGALRFVAPDTMTTHPDWEGKPRPTDLLYKKTYKVEPVLEAVQKASRACYNMPMQISLDEQTVGCRCEWGILGTMSLRSTPRPPPPGST